jgi:3-hydroxyacyl-[acyl-carrier-protein] dehydratase
VSQALALDRAAIEARLPHREPFLFLDRARCDPADAARLEAEWRVPREADFFRGHYPGNPLTPGVILCEHVLQAAALLLAERGSSFGARSGVPVVARIEQARFRRPVRPGEELRTEVRLLEQVGPAFHLAGRARVGERLALSLACVLMRADGAQGSEP